MKFREFIKYSKLLIQILTSFIDIEVIEIFQNLRVALSDHWLYNYPQAHQQSPQIQIALFSDRLEC